jgi:hypothetical protein
VDSRSVSPRRKGFLTQSLAHLKTALYGTKKQVLIDVISVWLDESSDQKQKKVFTVGGFLQHGDQWFELERDWQRVLQEEGIAYFRASDCAGVDGPFLKFRADSEKVTDKDRQRAFAVRSRLLDSIQKADLIGVAVSIVIEDFNAIMATNQQARQCFNQDPFFTAYQLVMVETAKRVSEQLPDEIIAFVYDENQKQSQAEAVYVAVKEKNPAFGRYMGSLSHMDDKTTPALQAADLMASEARRDTEAWLANGKRSHVFQTALYCHATPYGINLTVRSSYDFLQCPARSSSTPRIFIQQSRSSYDSPVETAAFDVRVILHDGFVLTCVRATA